MANIQKLSENEIAELKKNLNKYPYLGAMTAIAKSRNITRNSVWNAIHKRNNKQYLELIYNIGQEKMQRDLANAKKLAS